MKIILFIIITLFIYTPGFTQTYKWIDGKGRVHFTDDITKIPEQYKDKAERIGMVEDKTETNVPGEPSSKTKADSYKDRLGRGEEYWKNRVEEWKKRLKDAQDKVEQARLKYNELTEKYNDTRSSVARNQIRIEREQFKQEMDRQKGNIEEAKLMLEKKIPEEAELYKAKPEWIEQ